MNDSTPESNWHILKPFLSALGIVAVWLLMMALGVWLHAQPAERLPVVAPTTKQWDIYLNLLDNPYRYLHVVDTPGVCIYLFEKTVAAVPKSQLPVGTGCQ